MIVAYLIFGHLSFFVNPAIALLMGIILSATVGNPFLEKTKRISSRLLKYCIVMLGFGVNFHESLAAGWEGMLLTIASVAVVMVVGVVLGRWLGVGRKSSYLISSGTAICGGSAIEALSPVIDADSSDTSLSLAVIFILNGVALLIFPPLGKVLSLTQEQFGVWSALAIHDISSVMGAGAIYGEEALQVATMVKLTRALWIIPLSIVSIFLFKVSGKKIKIPYFILLFVVAMAINSLFELPHAFTTVVDRASRAGINGALFLIGTGLTPEVIKSTGVRPLAQGLLLWIVISLLSLAAVIAVC